MGFLDVQISILSASLKALKKRRDDILMATGRGLYLWKWKYVNFWLKSSKLPKKISNQGIIGIPREVTKFRENDQKWPKISLMMYNVNTRPLSAATNPAWNLSERKPMRMLNCKLCSLHSGVSATVWRPVRRMEGARCIGIKFPLTTLSGIGEIHKENSAPFIVQKGIILWKSVFAWF